MKFYLTYLTILNLICDLFCQSIENQSVAASKGDNLHVISSTFQLQELLRKEVKMVQELKKYFALLREEMDKVENYLNRNYHSDNLLPRNDEGILLFQLFFILNLYL